MVDLDKQLVSTLISQLQTIPDDPGPAAGDLDRLPAGLDPSYLQFMAACNGGYTSDHFMHLLGTQGPPEHNLFEWNRVELWKQFYGLGADALMFAEDIFGNQFYFDLKEKPGTVNILWVDNGKHFRCSPTLQDFVEDYVVGRDVVQEIHGFAMEFLSRKARDYKAFQHLAYKHPILLGGSGDDLANVELSRPIVHLRLLGQIVSQVKGLPKGTVIKKVVVDNAKMEVKLIT